MDFDHQLTMHTNDTGQLLADWFHWLEPVTDHGVQFKGHCTYAVLAALWGRIPALENIKHPVVGEHPDWVDVNDPMEVLRHRRDEALPSIAALAKALMELVATEGPIQVMNAIVGVRAEWARDILDHWNEAVDAYGPHPSDLELTIAVDGNYTLRYPTLLFGDKGTDTGVRDQATGITVRVRLEYEHAGV